MRYDKRISALETLRKSLHQVQNNLSDKSGSIKNVTIPASDWNNSSAKVSAETMINDIGVATTNFMSDYANIIGVISKQISKIEQEKIDEYQKYCYLITKYTLAEYSEFVAKLKQYGVDESVQEQLINIFYKINY